MEVDGVRLRGTTGPGRGEGATRQGNTVGLDRHSCTLLPRMLLILSLLLHWRFNSVIPSRFLIFIFLFFFSKRIFGVDSVSTEIFFYVAPEMFPSRPLCDGHCSHHRLHYLHSNNKTDHRRSTSTVRQFLSVERWRNLPSPNFLVRDSSDTN